MYTFHIWESILPINFKFGMWVETNIKKACNNSKADNPYHIYRALHQDIAKFAMMK